VNPVSRSLNALIRKASYIIREEGPLVFLDRARRAGTVRVRRLFRDSSENQARWGSLRGRFDGQRAFLLGNGPSLNRLPLHLLANERTMCFNRFNLMFERLPWRPSMFCIIDDRVLMDMSAEVDSILQEVDFGFFPDLHPYDIDFTKHIRPRDNIYWLHLDRLSFSTDLPWCGINKTVANVGLQVLAFLGFTTIYVIGVDMDYVTQASVTQHTRRDVTAQEDDDPNHFDPRYFGAGRAYHHPRMDETAEKFREARHFFDNLGVSVINAGIGGKLDAFPRADFRSLFSVSPLEEIKLLLTPLGGVPAEPTLSAAFPGSVHIERGADWPTDAEQIICSVDDAIRHFRHAVFRYLPLGPFFDEYVFVRRDTIRS
jgi:hypothetical protein